MQITNSEMTCWLGCRRRWLWGYGLGLELRRVERPLWLGRAIHEGLAAWWRVLGASGNAQPPPSLMRYVLCAGVVDSEIQDWATEAASRGRQDGQTYLPLGLGGTALDDVMAAAGVEPGMLDQLYLAGVSGASHEQREELREMVETAQGMLLGYARRWLRDAERYEVVSVEQPVERPIKAKVAPAKSKFLLGKPDLVVRDRGDGRLRVVEHKTAADRRLEESILGYQVDTQPRAYVTLVDAETGERPVSVVYDFLRKKAPSEPRMVQCRQGHKGLSAPCRACGTLTGKLEDGSAAKSVSTAAIDTTAELYLDAVRFVGGDPEWPEYRAIIDAAQQNLYFHREEVFIGDKELDEYEGELHLVALELAEARRRVRQLCPDVTAPTTLVARRSFPRNPAYCWRYGRPCSFTALCLDDSPEARREYDRREAYHPEYKAEAAGE